MPDARTEIGKALESWLSPEIINTLMTEVLETKKKAWADISCKGCGKKQRVLCEVADASAVTKALIELANQAWGRPAQAESEADERITFIREVRK